MNKFIGNSLVFVTSTLMIACANSKNLDRDELQRIYRDVQNLARAQKGFPCYSIDRSSSEELLHLLLISNASNISSYEYPPRWANKDQQDMLSAYVVLKNDKAENREIFTLEIKLIDGNVTCYDLARVVF